MNMKLILTLLVIAASLTMPVSGQQTAKEWLEKGNALCDQGRYDLGKYDDAIACYDKALQLDPTNAEAWYGKGLAFQAQGKSADAEDCFNKAKQFVLGEEYSVQALGAAGKPWTEVADAIGHSTTEARRIYARGLDLPLVSKENIKILERYVDLIERAEEINLQTPTEALDEAAESSASVRILTEDDVDAVERLGKALTNVGGQRQRNDKVIEPTLKAKATLWQILPQSQMIKAEPEKKLPKPSYMGFFGAGI